MRLAKDRYAALLHSLVHFWKNENGATAIEYGLIVGIISAALIGGATQLSSNINGVFQFIVDTFNSISI
ncbi:Fimbriae Associated Protein [Agrobacterium tumefaciens]|nr:Fimbriae Associated Protein [Agrobacterium tumefaciens]